MLEFRFDKALIIAPHPDDEVLGCGGTILRLKRAGAEVYVLYMTAGVTTDFSPGGVSTAQERLEEAGEVARFLGLDGFAMAFPGDDYHLRLDALPQRDLIHAIEKGGDVSLEGVRPDVVFTPPVSDYNQDHRAVSQATFTAARPASPRYKSFQPAILTYELPYHQWNLAAMLPNPGVLVRLDESDLSSKLEAMKLYKSQLKAPESPLSLYGIEVAARFRGLQCGGGAAEAFQVGRIVW